MWIKSVLLIFNICIDSVYWTLCGFPGPSCPVWARGRCRISPPRWPRFLIECCKRQLNQGSFGLLYFKSFTFSFFCIEFVYLYFPALFCLSVSVKPLAVKTASEMTYIVSSGALNYNQPIVGQHIACVYWQMKRLCNTIRCFSCSICCPVAYVYVI